MNRRDFLASSSAGIGYSLIVDGRAVLAGEAPVSEAAPPGFAPATGTLSPNTSPTEPNMTLVDVQTDVLVCGGGMAGVCAALSAARNGAKVLLVQDRSRLWGQRVE